MVKVMSKWFRENYREYSLVGLILIIGLIIGVMIVNNSSEDKMQEMSSYVGEFVTKFKNIEDLSTAELIGVSIKNNIILALILWLAGTTIIGLPVVLIMILYRGLAIGYTVAVFSYSLGKLHRSII